MLENSMRMNAYEKDPTLKYAQGNHGSHSSHFSGDTHKHIYRIIEKSGTRAD